MSHRLVSVGIALALLFGAMAMMSATEDAQVGATIALETEVPEGENTTAGTGSDDGSAEENGTDDRDDTYGDDDPDGENTTGGGDDGLGDDVVVDDNKTTDGDDDTPGEHTDGDDDRIDEGGHTDGDDDTSGGHTDGDDDTTDGDEKFTEGEPKDDLEGEWEATDEDGDEWTFEFEGDRFTIDTPNGTYKGTYTVDETQDPPTIDLSISEAPEGDEESEGQVSKGIYDTEGGGLDIALGEPGGERPASFTEEGALSLEASYVTPPEDDDDDDESTPGFGAMLLLGAMGALAVAMVIIGRRR